MPSSRARGALCGIRFSPFCAKPNASTTASALAIPRAPHPLFRPLADGLTLLEHMVAGAVAAATSTLVMHPMDTIKTVAQAQGVSAISAARGRIGEAGASGLYRGALASVASQAPAGSVKLAVFEGVTQWLRKVRPGLSDSTLELGSAAIAFIACSIVLVPGEVVKQRLQAGVRRKVGEGIVGEIWRKEGIRGFYSGYQAVLARDVPYTMVEFGCFSKLKRMGRKALGREKLSAGEEWGLGGIAGGFTGFVTTPLDLAKTKLMTQVKIAPSIAGGGAVAVGGLVEGQYSGVLDVFAKVARKEGLPGLFRGGMARVVWLIPFTAVFFGVHGMSKRVLLQRKPVVEGKAEKSFRASKAKKMKK